MRSNSSDVINDSDASDTTSRQTNTKYQRSLINKKCRDDLKEMRDVNSLEAKQDEPSFLDYISQEENKNKAHKITDDLLMEKYFKNNFSVNKSERKYFTYGPSTTAQDIMFNPKNTNKLDNESSGFDYLLLKVVELESELNKLRKI